MVTRWHRAVLLIGVAGLTLASAGCVGDAERDSAVTVARDMMSAAASGDGGTACRLLAPDTRAAVEESTGQRCAQAITEEDLPQPGSVEVVDVYGQWARVVTTSDTIFLGAFGEGWRVVAAGCEPRGERPYDCAIQGE